MPTGDFQYHCAVWQQTVAPEASTHIEVELDQVMADLAANKWDIFHIDSEALGNNLYRVLLFCRRMARDAPPPMTEPAATAEAPPAPPPPAEEDEDDDDKPTRTRRGR